MAVVVGVVGCSQGPSKVYTSSSGSAALSRNDAFLYVVDSDNDLLAVVDTSTQAKIAEVKVGTAPEHVVVGPDDTVYVSNRGSRNVSVVTRAGGQWSETDRIAVGIEPVGMAVSPDNKILYVVNSTTLSDPSVGSVMAIDVPTHQIQWEQVVGEEPRGIALLEGNVAAVSLYKQGDLSRLDLVTHEVTQGTDLYLQANLTASASNQSGITMETLHPRGAATAVVGPDGTRVFMPTMFSSEALLPALDLDGGSGMAFQGTQVTCSAYGGNTSCGGSPNGGPEGSVVEPGLATFQSGKLLTSKVDDLAHRQIASTGDYPGTLLGSGNFQEPVAAAVDSTGSWVYIVNRATNNVAIVPMSRSGGSNDTQSVDFAAPIPGAPGAIGLAPSLPAGVFRVDVGQGPTGIALSRDNRTAYVYNAFDHSVSVLSSVNGSIVQSAVIPIAQDVLPPDVVAGRALFFTALNLDVSNPSIGVSCGSCHLEGREDGHVWSFSDGPRQTPQLVGRMLDQTAPYHWTGQLPTIDNFMQLTITQRMGGQGLNQTEEQQLVSFLTTVAAPDNPFRGAQLNAQQIHGAQLFVTAQCSTCHAGAAYTNNNFADVGTTVTAGAHPDQLSSGLNVPSLLGVARSAPYLHDGSAPTLKARLVRDEGTARHGNVAILSDSDMNDLVAFLQTL